MFIELVDALRCPRPHEESWLVLSAARVEARHIVDGALGCPICHAEYVIRDGVADFRANEPERHTTDVEQRMATVDAKQLAAMLNLADPLGFAVLTATWATRAEALLELVDGPPLLLIDPPADVAMRAGLSGVRCDAALPLAVGAARAAAVDTRDETRLGSAVRATRTGGRIVAPVGAPLPGGVRELARDDRVWVGEREAAPSGLVSLHVRRR